MELLEMVAERFRSRGFRARLFDQAAEVLPSLLETIPPSATVAFGGSVTLQELGVYEALRERGQDVLWHWKVPPAEAGPLRRRALSADVYVSSSNAVIEDGRLLNIDGTGNRVAAMIFGPPRVIVVAGKNKLAHDYAAALERIHSVACPKNAERLDRNVPCRHTGRCADCRSPQRMCQFTVTVEHCPDAVEMEVWLVNEDLGY